MAQQNRVVKCKPLRARMQSAHHMTLYVLTDAEAYRRCPIHHVPCQKSALVAARPRSIVTSDIRSLATAKKLRELQPGSGCLDDGHDSDTCLSTSALLPTDITGRRLQQRHHDRENTTAETSFHLKYHKHQDACTNRTCCRSLFLL